MPLLSRFLTLRASLAGVLDLAAWGAAAIGLWILWQTAEPASYAGTAVILGAAILVGFDLSFPVNEGRRQPGLSVRAGSLAVVAAALVAVVVFAGASADPARDPFVRAVLPAPILVALASHLRWAITRPTLAHRILVMGGGDLAYEISRSVQAHRHLGAEIAGFLCDRDGNGCDPRIPDEAILGRIGETEKVLSEFGIDRVVLATQFGEEVPEEALLAVKLRGLPVDSGYAFYEELTGRVYLRDGPASRLLNSSGFEPGPIYSISVRVADWVLSAIGLTLTAPLLGVAALAIRLDSPGPVLYSQVRLGANRRPFRLWKLRTMQSNAEAGGAALTGADDPRVTRVGRFLRKTRIDELPQLWNVLRGDMSIVGPRPERPEFVDELSGRYPLFRYRTVIRPGITGWAQVRHGYVNDLQGFEEKLSHDLFYLKHRGVLMDLMILGITVKTLIQMRGL